MGLWVFAPVVPHAVSIEIAATTKTDSTTSKAGLMRSHCPALVTEILIFVNLGMVNRYRRTGGCERRIRLQLLQPNRVRLMAPVWPFPIYVDFN